MGLTDSSKPPFVCVPMWIKPTGRPDTCFWCFAIAFKLSPFVTTPELSPCWCREKKEKVSHEKRERVADWCEVRKCHQCCGGSYILLQFANHVAIFVRRTNLRASPEVLLLQAIIDCLYSSEPLHLCRVIGAKFFFFCYLYRNSEAFVPNPLWTWMKKQVSCVTVTMIFLKENWRAQNFITREPQKSSSVTYTRTFVKKNAPKYEILRGCVVVFFNNEIAIFRQVSSTRLPKYSRILKIFYFHLLHV
jgi:hypothetical protein